VAVPRGDRHPRPTPVAGRVRVAPRQRGESDQPDPQARALRPWHDARRRRRDRDLGPGRQRLGRDVAVPPPDDHDRGCGRLRVTVRSAAGPTSNGRPASTRCSRDAGAQTWPISQATPSIARQPR
jgi:hypothetical protein